MSWRNFFERNENLIEFANWMELKVSERRVAFMGNVEMFGEYRACRRIIDTGRVDDAVYLIYSKAAANSMNPIECWPNSTVQSIRLADGRSASVPSHRRCRVPFQMNLTSRRLVANNGRIESALTMPATPLFFVSVPPNVLKAAHNSLGSYRATNQQLVSNCHPSAILDI